MAKIGVNFCKNTGKRAAGEKNGLKWHNMLTLFKLTKN